MNPPNKLTLARGSIITSISLSFIVFTAIFHFQTNATSSSQQVSKYEILHAFTGNAGYGFNGDTDGANPYGPLIEAPDGNFYGTTMSGSATATAPTGTVFKMTASGEITILHHFTMTTGGDGVNPYSGLILASDGNFYGTTYTAVGATGGGANGGVVFRITPSGNYTKLFTFSGVEGAYPKAGLIQGKDGKLYGTSSKGGFDGRYVYGGTVYRVGLSGGPAAVHLFTVKDGVAPTCDLLQASDGALYGTTYAGGANGFGTVFRLTTSGAYTVLRNLVAADGANPVGGLTQAPDGTIYGTTATAGQYGLGTVFKIDRSGAFSVLYNFRAIDGGKPLGILLLANDGNLYGTTNNAGRNYGTVFKLTPTGTFTLLHSFGEFKGDGGLPVAGLIQARDGRLYGTTQFGGPQNKGVIFRLDLGLGPITNPSATPTPTSSPTGTPRPSPSPGASPTPVPSPTPGPTCGNSCGVVQGNGRLEERADGSRFDFHIRSTGTTSAPQGNVEFVDRETRKRFRSTSITCLIIVGDHATITGTGTLDDTPVTFQIEIEEKPHGQVGSFFIVLSNGYKRGGAGHGSKVDVRPCR